MSYNILMYTSLRPRTTAHQPLQPVLHQDVPVRHSCCGCSYSGRFNIGEEGRLQGGRAGPREEERTPGRKGGLRRGPDSGEGLRVGSVLQGGGRTPWRGVQTPERMQTPESDPASEASNRGIIRRRSPLILLPHRPVGPVGSKSIYNNKNKEIIFEHLLLPRLKRY